MSNISFPLSIEEVPDFAQVKPVNQVSYLRGGLMIPATRTKKLYSPITVGGEPFYLGTLPDMTAAESLSSLDAAVTAYNGGRGEWPSMSVSQRCDAMRKFVSLMKLHKDHIVRFLMWEICKKYSDSVAEFERTVKYVEDTIAAYEKKQTIVTNEIEGYLVKYKTTPRGVVLCMAPFNYPLNETFTNLIPAILCGNTVIFKPAKLGVMLLEPLLECFRQAFPAGVVNTVYGEGKEQIQPIMESGKINILAFIGSDFVANIVLGYAKNRTEITCVFGGGAKNAGIALKSANIVKYINEILAGAYSNSSMRCTALKILWIHRSLINAFLKLIVPAVEALPVTMPWDTEASSPTIIPLPEPNKIQAMRALLDEAISKGAQILNKGGGEAVGCLMNPVLLFNVTPDMKIYWDEPFGPILPIVVFDDIQEVIDYHHQSPYGQQASIFGEDEEEVAYIDDALDNLVARTNINMQCQRGPDAVLFDGRKKSALTALSMDKALDVYSIVKVQARKK